MGAIFLSASVPVPGRGDFHESADPMLIHAAIRALVSVVLGRRLIVWGGHPAITPMVWAAAEDLQVSYESAVHLYQSEFFARHFPKENRQFKNVTIVDSIDEDREKSLQRMREEMLTHYKFDAGVFVGGMEGLIDEYHLFKQYHSKANVIPVLAAGGATLKLPELMTDGHGAVSNTVGFVRLFHETLRIDPTEARDLSAVKSV